MKKHFFARINESQQNWVDGVIGVVGVDGVVGVVGVDGVHSVLLGDGQITEISYDF